MKIKLPNEELALILVENNYIEEADLKGFPTSHFDNIVDFLIAKGVLSPDLIGQALAEHYSLNYIDLSVNSPSKAQVLEIPEHIAKKYRIIPYEILEDKIVLATDEPALAEQIPNSAKFLHKRRYELIYTLTDSIDSFLEYYKKALGSKLIKIIESENLIAPKLLEAIIFDAIDEKASDIHLEPSEEGVVIRFRIDGLLQEVTSIPKQKYESVLNKIKVEAKLRIDQHDATLDGAIRYPTDDGHVDLRISIIPTITGEKVAIRVLKRYVDTSNLTALGLTRENVQILESVIHKPHGMVIVTGPTGSGKTTTLYALLQKLNQRSANITTIEDPVEYRIKGVNQIQVNNETGVTFAKGLRSIVRQDPDIILLGEIRDIESAEIAVNSALTGHLLLSSFHSNTATAAIPRLIDMGIEPFLLASTLEVIVAQKLVRKLCTACRYSKDVDNKEFNTISGAIHQAPKKGKTTLYFSKGCDACNHSGYFGRTALYEIINVDKELREMIATLATADQIWSAAEKKGARSLFDDGIEKVKAGVTSLDEILRVSRDR